MDNRTENDFEFEDISSSTKENQTKNLSEINGYAQKAFSHMDTVLKVIAFIVAIGVFIVFTAIAAIVAYLDKAFVIISVGIIVIGVIISLILLFFIYGIGQVITQNNEILKRMR